MNESPETITFDDFTKLDLRVAKVLEACEHPNADRLLILKIDLGTEQRQLVAGLKGYYQPEDLVGRLIVVVKNLAPRKMRGEESQGMLLAGIGTDRGRCSGHGSRMAPAITVVHSPSLSPIADCVTFRVL